MSARTIEILLKALGGMRRGRLAIRLPDGSATTMEGEAPGPAAEVRIHRLRAFRRVLSRGGLGFAEGYLAGDWSTPDLPALIYVLALNHEAFGSAIGNSRTRRWLSRLHHMARFNSRRGSRRNIHAHYDLGNRFYGAWLDRTMTYSSALFAGGERELEAGQNAKYAHLARMIDLRPEHELLEIGGGWGGFALFSAGEVGARVTMTTISRAQHRLASERVQKAGLGDRIEVRLEDYRDTSGTFDRVASIEMFEAVGEAYWPVFFERLRDRLRHGGVAGLQIITIADEWFETYRRSVDFIQRYVFPGGMLPSPAALSRSFGRAGLDLAGVRNFGTDYAETLSMWNRRFQEAWPRLASSEGLDERFRRLWSYYLAYTEAGFRMGWTDVGQYRLVRA